MPDLEYSILESIVREEGWLYYSVLSMVKDAQTAMDVAQETVLRALQSQPKFDNTGSLRAWLLKVSRNVWMDMARVRRRELLQDDLIEGVEVAAGLLPLDILENRETRAYVRQAISGLEPLHRAPLVMRDPRAMLMAHAAAHAVEFVGMPEARIPLAEAVIYIACAPKSNACVCAIDAALEAVRNGGEDRVPVHLRDASYKGAQKLGHGIGYKYPHDFPGNFVQQRYLPDGVDGPFYTANGQGLEQQVRTRLEGLWPGRGRK